MQLKGFNGTKTTSKEGLRWTVKLGNLWGTITTYVVPGETPFLLPRKVLEGMKATLDLGSVAMSSEKHGIQNMKLGQAANGHLLMPLLPDDNEGCFLAETGRDPQEYKGRESRVFPKSGNYRPGAPSASLRNTRHCQVDVVANQEAFQTLFGCEVHFALCAYRPKFEHTF